MKKIYESMVKNIEQDTSMEPALCAFEDDNNNQVLRGDIESKELCKMLIRTFLWMNKMKQVYKDIVGWTWDKDETNYGNEEELQSYFRCIIGRMTILKMLGKHCKLGKVAPVVEGALGGILEHLGVKYDHDKCDEMDLGSLSLGGKLFWGEIEKWIYEKKEEGKVIRGRKDQGKNCPEKSSLNDIGKNMSEKEKKSAVKLLGGGNIENLQKMIERNDHAKKEDTNKVLDIIRKEGEDTEKLRNILQQVDQNLNDLLQKNLKKSEAKKEQGPNTKLTRQDTSGQKDAVQEEPGKTATSPKVATPSKEECRKIIEKGVVDANVDAAACLSLDGDDDDQTIASSAPLSDEHHEATSQTGPKGIPGTKPAETTTVASGNSSDHAPNITASTSTTQAAVLQPSVEPTQPIPEAASANSQPEVIKPNVDDNKAPSSSSTSTSQGAGEPGKNGQPGSAFSSHQVPQPSVEPTQPAVSGGRGGSATGKGGSATRLPSAAKHTDIKDNPFLPYLPVIPTIIGITTMTYLFWKYFGMLGKKRKRHKRAHQVRGPTVQEQLHAHVGDQADGPHEYTLVKERRQPRSVPTRRKEKVGKRSSRRRGVRRRMIIDIHLEVLDECQKGHLHSTKEDFFEILVQEFMGSGFIEENFLPKEQVQSSDSGCREEAFVPKGRVAKEQASMVDVPKEQVPMFRFRV
ncbi:SICA antigen [Plasmodium coatneyi]|uniref:SICA antigen n=1 Tax=Plasmodium coatneyi TaxID=208452 RepID=A0A1B1DWV4_9APIC|nr:SICA antigen [Plasmodium coatneyi]ANQ07262.1 SICA antigen [Plasmodium coatneyi]